MSEPRKVDLIFTSNYNAPEDTEIVVTSLEDLESLSIEHGCPLIISVGKDGKLSSVEVYNGYRE